MYICHSSASFLVVICWDEVERIIDIKQKVQACFEPTQRFELLLFTTSKRPKVSVHIPSRVSIVSRSDFNLLGTIKNSRRIAIQQERFDIGMILSPLTKPQEKFLRSITIKHTVGFDYDQDFIDVNLIAQSHQLPDKIAFAKNILSKITTPELRIKTIKKQSRHTKNLFSPKKMN